MNAQPFTLAGHHLIARASGALYWPAQRLLCISDLHLGKSERIARRSGTLLPPYEVHDTLTRLESEITATEARHVVCLGDSFDDLDSMLSLPEDARLWLTRLMAGRDWTWIEGNHDPGPVTIGGTHRAALALDGLTFRHIASAQKGEISGHYHPKAVLTPKGRQVSRPCFLIDSVRAILPAFGTYTGGLRWSDPVFGALMEPGARAYLTGAAVHVVPMPARRPT
ncbi:ligase-associated DNA damage response endonuclease PdeM [Oceaniovalibus sp. ACAM 378]|uniref:ligase-associated DNA damage response endonuclease PdeM n=1 Tax=Oceaniovalibus sp. ACAM 378 TaxID=2599923 RepID=UPI0011D9132F|nr:ligase-associated DNA damage response endonuclease PdeM [Oceaniovalibus sp. ACAM 378]TYB84889.1 ligase-associated DNA damage response endonuclease PdeM [Oceaniovalibus sp. ACAM 378]